MGGEAAGWRPSTS
uniref:Uncharacterized protein n=1 Tax=Arundo donax TaxID=35708 RepID=A0A0A8ZR40_ARUDO